jgi:hypothetical protein
MDSAWLGTCVTLASLARLAGLTWVGARVLSIAWRTRSTAESLLGASFLCFSTLGVPLLTYAGYGSASVSDASPALLGLALALLDVGTLLFAEFVRRVFRPDSRVALVAVAVASAALVAHVVLSTRAVAGAPPSLSPVQAIGRRELILSFTMSAIFLWGALDASSYALQLARRSRLGLADPDALRRIAWFAAGCAAQIAMMVFTMIASLRGTNPLADPLPAIGIAASSLATGLAVGVALGARTSPRATAAAPQRP